MKPTDVPKLSAIPNGDNAATAQRQQSPAAERALVEAEKRRAENTNVKSTAEVSGRGGLEPVRYGDWEIKGLASDF